MSNPKDNELGSENDYYESWKKLQQKEQELLKEIKRLKEDIHNRVVEKIHLKMQPLFNDAKLEEENQQLKKEIERLNNQLQEKINYVNTIDEINAGLEYQADNLEQRLKEQKKKIELMIEHFEFLGSSGDNYAKNVTKKLKYLLESGTLCGKVDEEGQQSTDNRVLKIQRRK